LFRKEKEKREGLGSTLSFLGRLDSMLLLHSFLACLVV